MPETLTRKAEEAKPDDVRNRRIIRLEDWTDEDIAALEATSMEPGHEALDAEIEGVDLGT